MLETVGAQFLTGYAHAVEAADAADAEARLDAIGPQWRGFAYEGAGMGFAMLDGLPLFPGTGRLDRFYETAGGDAHIYLAYVGVGWAMARLPRFMWSKLSMPDPLLRWLALDGYGFHQAYFKTQKYVHEQYVDAEFPFPPGSDPADANHVIDQGIGRAMWFVGGTDPTVVADLIDSFPESRRGDMYAGTGLAATYAAGATEPELLTLRERAGEYRFQLAQGSAFAADARVRGGNVLPQTAVSTWALCGTTPQEAARICAETRPTADESAGGVPAWDIWRRRIADVFAGTKVGGE